MATPHSLTTRLLNLFLRPKPQPRCSCGRYCSTHDQAPDMTAKLVSERLERGLYVPAKLRQRGVQ